MINNFQIKCPKNNIANLSPFAEHFFNENPKSTEKKINISQNDIHINLIELLLQNRKIHYNSSNDLFLFEFAKELQIQSIEDMAENWEIYELQKIEEIIFNINDINIVKYQKKLVKKNNLVGKEIICRMIINACIARPVKNQYLPKIYSFFTN